MEELSLFHKLLIAVLTTGACFVASEDMYSYTYKDDMCIKEKNLDGKKLKKCTEMLPVCIECSEDETLCAQGETTASEKVFDQNPAAFAKVARVTHLSLANRKFNFDTIHRNTFNLIENLTCISFDAWMPDSGLGPALPVMDNCDYVSANFDPEVGTFNSTAMMLFLKYVTTIPTLRQLSVACGNIPYLFAVGNSSVEKLGLSWNPLQALNMSQLCGYTRLAELSFDHCDISRTVLLNCTLQKLEKLDLSHNKLTSLPTFCRLKPKQASFLPRLQFLNISNNNIVIKSKADHCLPELRIVDLSEVTIIISKLSKPYRFPFRRSRNLSVIVADDSRLKILETYTDDYLKRSYIGAFAFGFINLKHLSMVNNGRPVDGIVFGVWGIEDAKNRNPFNNSNNLENVILDGQDFSRVNQSRFLELFGQMKRLKHLSLRRCQIADTVPFSGLAYPDLERLVVSDNEILYISDGAFDFLPSLRFLDLSHNQIRVVSEETFRDRVQQRLQSVSLVNNPLLCTCDIKWLKDWMESHPAVFSTGNRSVNLHYCRLMDSDYKAVLFTDLVMPKQACLLSRELSMFIVLNSSLLVAVLMILMLVFRFRWHIRLLLYEAFRGKGNNARRLRLRQNNFDYDIFVSYTGQDLPWVRRYIMPELEDRRGLKLCVHERDFIPGNNIVDNIVDCVDRSKKVIMLFSKHFVRSHWCQFELNFCIRRVMDYDDGLVVVCLDDVASGDMTPAMMAVMKTTTYIQWREGDANAVASFWGRLMLALAEIYDNRDQPL